MREISKTNIISLKELCGLLNIEHTARVFILKVVYKKMPNLIYSVCIPKRACRDIEHHKFNVNKYYNRSKTGIYIPDFDIIKFYEWEQERNADSVQKIVDKIFHRIDISKEKRALYYSVFSLLHEVGHWKYYEYCHEEGLTDKQIYQKDAKKKKEVFDLDKRIIKMKDDDPTKIELNKKKNNIYREIPSEHAADIYAYKYLDETINFVINELKKSGCANEIMSYDNFSI